MLGRIIRPCFLMLFYFSGKFFNHTQSLISKLSVISTFRKFYVTGISPYVFTVVFKTQPFYYCSSLLGVQFSLDFNGHYRLIFYNSMVYFPLVCAELFHPLTAAAMLHLSCTVCSRYDC